VKPGSQVRVEAARSLDRVTRTGAYSNIVVHTTELVGQDRASHQHLVYTALRWLLPIDGAISAVSDRSLDRIQPAVLAVLRVAGTELLLLGHDAYGVVDGAVDAVGELGHPKAKGFVNAVCRSLQIPPDELPDRASFPTWMVESLESQFPDIDRLLASLNQPAPIGVRVRREGAHGLRPVVGIASGMYASADADVGTLEAEGVIDVIDPASTAVVEALALERGHTVADLAAAPGGKTRAIADVVGRSGMVVASDTHRSRLRSAVRRSSDIPTIDWLRADAEHPPYRSQMFDRVLLDAPCTGLGTLRRRPEIRHRIDSGAPGRYGELQRRLLERAMSLVKPGGRLVYSVCTLFPDETVNVVAGLGGHPPEAEVGAVRGDGALLTPLDPGTDGMFITVFDR